MTTFQTILFDDPPARDFDPPPETPTAQPQSPAMDESESAEADIFGDFDDEMGNATYSMVDSLKVAGVVPKKARKKVRNRLQPALSEAYGETTTDFTKARRNLNVKGLPYLDFRTRKPNGNMGCSSTIRST